MTEYKIYLFRHGQTTYNKERRFTGFNNPDLTFEGIRNAKEIANKLKNKKFQIAFHSHLKRSIKTLNEVLKYHKECKKVKEDDRIIERNYGKLNGTLHADFIEKNGVDAFNKYHRGFREQPPKGESFAMVERRVKDFIKDLKKLL